MPAPDPRGKKAPEFLARGLSHVQEMSMKPCPYCGTPMSNPRRVQCGVPECKLLYHRERNRRWQQEYKERTGTWWNSGGRRATYPRTCAQCGREWGAFSKTAKYCSFTCQNAHQYGPDRARKKSRRERRRETASRLLARADRGKSGRTRWVVGECSECVTPFVTYQAGARTCSPECAEARRKKRIRENAKRYWTKYSKKWISAEDRLAIYERDGWTCQLCFEPVDPNLHYLDAWAATLDHIVCRSWTEKPDHSPENLRLAHRWCNSVRGDESHHDPAVLVAA